MKQASAFGWNMIGSACYSVTSLFYLVVVTRICGVEDGGFFSLAYATAQLLLAIGRYGMRTYQSTDLKSEYSFYEYMLSRALTVFLMILLGVIYSLYTFNSRFIIISVLVISMKAIDAVEDVYHGRLQQTYHVDKMGKSQAIRNLYTAICFTGLLVLTRNLFLTILITVVSSSVLCITMNEYILKKHIKTDVVERRVEFKNVLKLLKSCTGIFIGTFLSLLIFNIPKYAMAGTLSADYQTYYSILFMPTFVITLLCEFVFKPTITTIAEYWFSGDKKRFKRSIILIYSILFVASIIVTLMGHFIGRSLLELIYGVDLSPFKLHFIVLLIGGGIGACVYLTYNILIAIRYDKSIKIVYGITALLCAIVVKPMITYLGMLGATLNYLLSSAVLFVIFLGVFIKICKKHS